MKRQLITLAIASGLALAGLATASAHDTNDGGDRGHGKRHGKHGWKHEGQTEHLTKKLDLTPDQQGKVQPIMDQAKPQLQAIHQDAMQKTKAVMDNAFGQIRLLLTPEQQQKLDAMDQAREAHHATRAAKQQ